MPAAPPSLASDSDKEELTRAAQGFHRDILSFTKLNVRLPEPLAKPHDWNLDVIDASGQRNKHLQVVYPHSLAPCTSGEAH